MDGQYLPDDEIDIDSLASSEPPEYVPQMFSEGGEVEEEDIEHYAKGGEASIESQTESMNQFLLADEADTAYAPMYPSESDVPERKTAKLMLKQLSTKSGGGKSKRAKEMSMPMGDLSPAIPELGAPPTEQEKLTQIATARSQYDALEKAYKLKAQAAQRAGKGLMKPTFNTVMFDQPTLEKSGPLMARTFNKGGEAVALEGMQNKARENEMYRATEKYLNSRGQMPDIKISRFLPDEANAEFNSMRLPLGSGTIKVNKDVIVSDFKKDIGPALLAHEITHAADRQMKQQAIEQRYKGTKFAEAYEKLVGPEGRNRLEPAKRADYEWAQGNRFYRSTPEEIAAHGVGAFSGPMLQDRAPLHVDPTAATEFQILLDLAQRDVNNGPKGLEKIPAFARKLFKYADGGPVYRADGSPASGERLTPQQIERLAADQAELNRYQPVMNTNIQRQGAKSRKLATERDINQLPDPQTYAFIQSALLGTPPDEVANQFSVFHPKRKEILGRAEQGFVAGNAALVGPAARMLKEVTAPAVKYLGKEAARQVERGMFNEGPLRNITPQPMYAVRPEGGGTTFTNVQSAAKNNASISKLDKMIDAGANPSIPGFPNEMGDAIENFWRSKAQNYFTRQYGTPSDPIFNQIISGQLRTPALQKQIPDYAIEQTRAGKTRVDPVTGESRFYPKYPQALEDLTRRYDEMTGLKGLAFNTKEPLFDPAYPSTMGDRGRQLESQLAEDVTEKMVAGGMDPNLINPKISLTGPRGDGGSDLLNYIPSEYKELYNLYKQPPEESNMINRIYKELGIGETKVPGVVPENIKRAIQTSEPIYDIDMPYKSALEDLLSPRNINQYLATLSPKEITKMRFEDVVKNSARYNLDMFNTQNLVNAVKSGKRIPEKTWKQGLSEPLMNFEKDGQNFTWHRILDNEATAIEGAYIGHSVGGYAKGGAYGPKEYRRFKEGEEVQVYTLRDSRGKPFTTVQVEKAYTGPLGRVLSESDIVRAKAEGRELGPMSTIVKQIKGNGAKTGNVAPKDADEGVLSFLRTYIKPDKIAESDSYLTPKLEEFKMDLSGRPRP